MRVACGWDGGHPAAEVPNVSLPWNSCSAIAKLIGPQATNITSSVATLNSFTSHNCLHCLGSYVRLPYPVIDPRHRSAGKGLLG